MKHTSLTPDLIEGRSIFKDKFIRQSAPDTRKKAAKNGFALDSSIDTLVKTAFSVSYNQGEKKTQGRKQRDQEKNACLCCGHKRNKSEVSLFRLQEGLDDYIHRLPLQKSRSPYKRLL